MRNIDVQFPSGREVLRSYWGFLRSGGLVIDGSRDIGEGEALMVQVRIQSLKQSYHFAGRMVKRSTDGARAFIAFNEGEDQDSMLNAAWADSDGVPQRKHRRFPAEDEVRYAVGAATELVAGRLLDLSPGGCRLRGVSALPVGSRLKMRALGLELDGQVRWTTPGNEMGIEFSKPELVRRRLQQQK
jgi:PilZ domain